MIIPVRIPLRVSSNKVLIPMHVSTNRVKIPMKINVAYNVVEGDTYTGETEVESLLYDTKTLNTKDKLLKDNITVLPITILDVDNPAGGYTVTIGKFN